MKDKKLIEKVILLREKNNDKISMYAIRNKASPYFCWSKFRKYSKESFDEIYFSQIDGLKLKFKNTILTINGRHSLFN